MTNQATPAISGQPVELRELGSDAEVLACHDLIRQLRPHLSVAQEWLERFRRQEADGYRGCALWQAGRPVALAGYRVQENLVHGRFLYVDDLVTDAASRSSGHGGQLLAHLQTEARRQACAKLVLDTSLSNVLGHRFYYRCGLLAQALRFNIPLEADV